MSVSSYQGQTGLKKLLGIRSLMVSWWASLFLAATALVLINEVNLRRARLVLGWEIVSGFNSWCQTFISVCNQPPTPTQPSIHPGSANEDQLRLGRKRQVWFIPIADECVMCR